MSDSSVIDESNALELPIGCWDLSGPPGAASLTSQTVDGALLDRVRKEIGDINDTNALQTALAASIAAEDYSLAASVRDQISKRIDWNSLGLPEWLTDRIVRLGFKFPTEIQRRTSPSLLAGSDVVIQSATGSGKTLAFLAATLARLDYPPLLLPEDLDGPQAIILVPTMELGVQCCLMVYKILGGNTSSGVPGDPANVFSYFGPKGISVRGLLNKEEVVRATTTSYIDGVHVLVATPAALLEVYTGENGKRNIFSDLKTLAIDEFDECFNQSPEAMTLLLACACNDNVSEQKPQIVLVGATIQDHQLEDALDARWIVDPVQIAVGKENAIPTSKPQIVLVGATTQEHQLEDALAARWIVDPVQIAVGKENAIPTSVIHRYIECDPSRRLVTLVRQLRQDLKQGNKDGAPVRAIIFAHSTEDAAAIAEPLYTSLWSEHVIAIMLPALTLLNVEDAAAIAEPLYTSLWNEHVIAIMLPAGTPLPWTDSLGLLMEELESSTSEMAEPIQNSEDQTFSTQRELAGSTPFSATEPIVALHAFRDNKATLLLCTPQASRGLDLPSASRGLDLPSVSHVYNLGCPDNTAQYLHRAGRTGRIGSTMMGGMVTTIINSGESSKMFNLAEKLELDLQKLEEDQSQPLIPESQSSPTDEGSEMSSEDVEKFKRGFDDIFTLM
eukprot:gene3454-13512_t